MKVSEALAHMRALPVRDLDDIVGDGAAVVLAPHPDDESLGCGGLIAESCARGRPPTVIFITDGSGSHPNSRMFPPERLRRTRAEEARAALRILGLTTPNNIAFLGLRDTAAPHLGRAFEEAVDSVAGIIPPGKRGAIFAPWRNDPHGDHVATHRIAEAVARRLRLRHLSYPVWGWTLPPSGDLDGTINGARLDIGRHLAAKQRAIAAHRSQHGELITDDPDGVHLSNDMLAFFRTSFEVFLSNDDA